VVGRYCYGFDVNTSLENVAAIYAAARFLGMASLEGTLAYSNTRVW